MKAQFSSIKVKCACLQSPFAVAPLPTKKILRVGVRSLDVQLDVFLKPIASNYLAGRGKIAIRQRIELIFFEKITALVAGQNFSTLVANLKTQY